MDLPNAIVCNRCCFSPRLHRTFGGGLVLAAFVNLVFFSPTLFSIWPSCDYAVVRVSTQAPDTSVEWWRELASGFTYAFGFTGTRRLLLLLMAMGFFTAPWSSLMPIFAAETFSADSRTFGFLIGASGWRNRRHLCACCARFGARARPGSRVD